VDAYEVAFPVLKRVGAPATLFAVTGFLDGQCWLWTDQVRYLFTGTRRTRAATTLDGEVLPLALEDPAARVETMRRVAARLKRMPEERRARAVDDLAAALDVVVPVRPPAEYAPISWDQARELERHGVALEAHTVTHPILTQVSSDRLRHELTHAKIRLEAELGRTVSVFCYPNGDCNAAVRDAVGRAGYTCAVLSTGGLNPVGVDPLGVTRVGAESDLARFAKTTSGFDSWQTSLWRPAGAES
jgi:peptidoglycan/xylan/chitin deacetylase (PgdA/CDA1 family)